MFKEIQEGSGTYQVEGNVSEKDIIEMSARILESKVLNTDYMCSSDDTKRYLKHKLQTSEREVFGIIFLNIRHQILALEDLAVGTVDSASVFPREIVKSVLSKRACCATILYHCHPSGDASPSKADEHITKRLKDALALIDVRVLDHLIVGSSEVLSFSECGLM